MLSEISQHLKEKIATFPKEDQLIFKNQVLPIRPENFSVIIPAQGEVNFIDGGQAEIMSSGNFCLSFIRVVRLGKVITKKEFYLLTTAAWNNDLIYESKIFGDLMVDEADLLISSNDASIKTGKERAPISMVANMARRFAELALADSKSIIDGSLDTKYPQEEKYLQGNALAKSSSLFTASGNSAVVLLHKLGPRGVWKYDAESFFVKLHPKSKHVFRYDGNPSLLPYLIQDASDPTFLGYPLGLVKADRFARISNEERKSLKMRFLLDNKNREIVTYLKATNAHDILDSMG